MSDLDFKVLAKADPALQDSLQSENEPEMFDGEQFLEDDDVNEEINEKKKKGKTVFRVPKGTSEYQAAWIVDKQVEEVDEDEESDEEDEDEDMEEAVSQEESASGK